MDVDYFEKSHTNLDIGNNAHQFQMHQFSWSFSMACKTLQYSTIWICVCDISICLCNIWICVCNISICVCNISICVCNISICVCNISICVCNNIPQSGYVCAIFRYVCAIFGYVCATFRYVCATFAICMERQINRNSNI